MYIERNLQETFEPVVTAYQQRTTHFKSILLEFIVISLKNFQNYAMHPNAYHQGCD
jgi:hypothetical protein